MSKALNTTTHRMVSLLVVVRIFHQLILAKRCRVQRGQVIAVHDGVVKDISKMPPEEQERILALSTQSDRPSQLTVHQMRDLKRKTQQHQQLEESEFRSNSESDQIQLVVTTLPEQQEITLEQR